MRAGFQLDYTRDIGRDMVILLAPHCERFEVMGSVRQGKSRVKDIRLLCVSNVHSTAGMLGGSSNHYALDAVLETYVGDGSIFRKRPNKRGHFTFGQANKLLVNFPTGIPIDVFSTSVENWGMSEVVRTGPAEFNIRLMQRFKELRMRGHAFGGVTGRNGEMIECPDEKTVFELAKLPWLEPEDRR